MLRIIVPSGNHWYRRFPRGSLNRNMGLATSTSSRSLWRVNRIAVMRPRSEIPIKVVKCSLRFTEVLAKWMCYGDLVRNLHVTMENAIIRESERDGAAFTTTVNGTAPRSQL